MATKNSIDSNIPIEVSNGGTAATTLTDHSVLVGSGTSAVKALTVGGAGELLVGAAGADPAFGTSANANFTFGGANSGATRTLTVSNTSNTASSAAVIETSVAGSSAADTYTSYTVTGVTGISIGLDNSDLDSLKIDGGSIGANTYFKSTTSGEVTKPLAPAFSAVAADQSNVTGNGALYTVIFNGTEIFDIGNNFDHTTGIFTVPVTGKYQFIFILTIEDIVAGNNLQTRIDTSNRTYIPLIRSPILIKDSSGKYSSRNIVLADMDASDTAEVVVFNSGEASNINDIVGASTFFSGYLAC